MNWKLKDILMVGVIAVLFGLVFLGADYLGTFIAAMLTPLGLADFGYEVIYGLWLMAGTLAAYIIQKPGAGVIAELLAATLELLYGSMFGPTVFISGTVQGLGAEIPFFATKYKKFSMPMMILSAIGAAIGSFLYDVIYNAYWNLNLGLLIAMFVVRCLSAIVFTAIGSKLIGDGLAKAGVLGGYALGMKQDSPEEVE